MCSPQGSRNVNSNSIAKQTEKSNAFIVLILFVRHQYLKIVSLFVISFVVPFTIAIRVCFSCLHFCYDDDDEDNYCIVR